MKSKFVIALLALSLSAPVFAQSHRDDDRKGGGRDDHSQREDRKDRDDHKDRGGRDDRGDRGGDRRDRGDQRAERGAGPERSFYRGGRLPPQYRNHRYVVQDWRGHRLSAPPRGYQWVQTGNDYVLVAIATGVILQLLLN
ncbi:RcnB family protein [Roseateles sp. GG27B]